MYDEPNYRYPDFEEPDYSNYTPEPPTEFYYANNFPTEPIEPNELYKKVKSKLESFNPAVPNKSKEMIEDMCKGFNECIRLNKSKNKSETLVYTPKTGSGKSVMAKMYISMLKNESSLIIVPTIEDANTFCEDINKWSGNSYYARTYYRVTDDNPKSDYHIEKSDIENYNCIVITHMMYITLNTYTKSGLYQSLIDKNFDLIVIDERISLYSRVTMSNEDITGLIDLFTKINAQTEYNLTNDITNLNGVLESIEKLTNLTSEKKKTSLILTVKKLEENNIVPVQFTTIYDMLKNDKTIQLDKLATNINKTHSKVAHNEVKDNIKDTLKTIEQLGKKDCAFVKSGNIHTLIFTEEIVTLFGSSVVLDATATINEIYYNTTYYKNDSVKLISTEDPRIYKNLTIYKAKGYPQGRTTIYKNLTATEQKEIAKSYINVASKLLSDSKDKILIVTFKDFIPLLKSKIGKHNIEITNWGNHVGKNKWSDCNKVMIIGWYRLPESEYIGNFINSTNNHQQASINLRDDTIEKYGQTQVIDDLVQATMRCSARKIVSQDGDCKKSEVYIFYGDNSQDKKVISRYMREFKGAKVVEWNPIEFSSMKRQSKSTDNIDIIIDYLKKVLIDKTINVKRKDIIDNTSLSKSSLDRTIKKDDFDEILDDNGYMQKTINKQSKVFCLK